MGGSATIDVVVRSEIDRVVSWARWGEGGVCVWLLCCTGELGTEVVDETAETGAGNGGDAVG